MTGDADRGRGARPEGGPSSGDRTSAAGGSSGGERREGGGHWGSIRRRKDEILNVRAELERRQGPVERWVFRAGELLASPVFFVALLAAHLVWIWLNVPALSPLEPFDPSPFPLLAMVASAEAPFLGLLILMRQDHDRRIAELREETALQVALHAERETSELIRMLERVEGALGTAPPADERSEVEEMRDPLDPRRLVETMRQEMEEVEGGERTEGDP